MTSQTVEWQFGALLRALPPAQAWSILTLLAIALVVLVIWLYRNTLRQLSKAARVSLTLIRSALGLLVLLCLANPTRIERKKQDSSGHDTLAVLVDRSDSMGTPDHRGVTRLSNAVRAWKQHENEAKEVFSKTTYQRFAIGVKSSQTLENAIESKEPGSETHLYSALKDTLASSPGAIVCLTDGLDTTSESSENLAREAQMRGVPLYFVAGKNRSNSSTMLNIREIKVPQSILRQSGFTASILIKAGAGQECELPVELWSGENKLSSARLSLASGLNTIPWSVNITAGEPGALPLEFRVGEGANQQIASCSTQVIEHTQVNLLYYQGALQWGYRFLLAALQSDPSFKMTSILNPALGVRMSIGGKGQSILSDLPEDARELAHFQIVVLAHVFASQLSQKQQQALVDYVKAGGAVLFIAPDTNATRQFAGTLIEQMLPVAFQGPEADKSESEMERVFQSEMSASSNRTGEEVLFNDTQRRGWMPRLVPFALPEGAVRSTTTDIFKNADPASMPKFCEHAKVRKLKAGATTLAVSGVGGREGSREILLARQSFGSGFSAALTTDLLWRWKMGLPSDNHSVEKFWQQLLLSLAPPSGHGLRLVKVNEMPSLHLPVEFRVEGSDDQAEPRVETISPAGEHKTLVSQKTTDADGTRWSAAFTPAASGRWEVRATDAAGNFARASFSVSEKPRTTETLNLPPNTDALRQLAESTGGALIGDEPVFQKQSPAEKDAAIVRSEPMWNSSWLLGALLGLYGVELITRRWLKLL